MTTPATTAWDRWIAWPGFANDDFNAFVASEVAAVERERDAAETRLAAAEGLLRRWLVWIEPGASVRPCPDGETRAFLSPPSPATGYGVGDDADGTDALLQRWEVWWAKAPCAPKHPAKAPDSRLPAAYRHLRATPAEATAAGIAVPDDGHDRADCPEWSKCSRHTTLQPAPAAEARPSHVRTTRAPSGTPLEAGVVAGVRRWSSDNEPIVEGGWVLLSGEWEPACPPTRAALLDALLGLSRNDHKDSALLVVDALDAYLRPWLAFVEAMAVVKADEARTERNTMDENVCIEAARALVAAKEVK